MRGIHRTLDQRVVVVSLDFFVATVSPIGETLVPLEVDPNEVTTPFTVVVFWLLVSVLSTGAGMTGFDVVVVVLEEVIARRQRPSSDKRPLSRRRRF